MLNEDKILLYEIIPIQVYAVRLTIDNIEVVEKWCKGSIKGTKLPVEKRVIDMQTLEGEMRVHIGDWIIKGIKGEFYFCTNDVFELHYREV